MLRKDITYFNLDGQQVTDTWFFALSKAELAEMEMLQGDMKAHLQALVASDDRAEIIKMFKTLLCSTVGKREGQRFIKNQDVIDEFMQTGAYSELFMELVQNPTKAAEFIKSIVPADLADKVDTAAASEQLATRAEEFIAPPAQIETIKKLSDYTVDQLLEMPDAEWDVLVGKNPRNWPKPIIAIAMQRAARG